MESQLDLHQIFERAGVVYYDLETGGPFQNIFYLDKEISYVPKEINHFILSNEKSAFRSPVSIEFKVRTKELTAIGRKRNTPSGMEYYETCFEKCYFKWKYLIPPKIFK